MYKPHVILLPTDFSECSRVAFAIGLDLARQNNARLLLLHVAESPGAEDISYSEATTQLQTESYHHRFEKQMRQTYGPTIGTTPVEYLVAEGGAVEQINRIAHEHHCDLIVCGTHGRRGLDRLLMGSTAEALVRSAPCPVLTVKLPPGHAAAGH
jgi:nucleotide-binding universal stress UspA family protein